MLWRYDDDRVMVLWYDDGVMVLWCCGDDGESD